MSRTCDPLLKAHGMKDAGAYGVRDDPLKRTSDSRKHLIFKVDQIRNLLVDKGWGLKSSRASNGFGKRYHFPTDVVHLTEHRPWSP